VSAVVEVEVDGAGQRRPIRREEERGMRRGGGGYSGRRTEVMTITIGVMAIGELCGSGLGGVTVGW
jgi:hypothetical protein